MRRKFVFRLHDAGYLFFALLSIICLGLSLKYPAANSRFNAVVSEVTSPLFMAAQKPGMWVNLLSTRVDEHVATVNENRRLKEENKALRALQSKLDLLRQENEELKDLVTMADDFPGEPIAVRVMSDAASPFTRSMLLKAGRDLGVKRGQEVVNEYGLVGRIVDVYPTTSRVLLITDYAFRIPVKIIENRVRGLVRGTGGLNMELMLLENEALVQSEMTVVTSGAGGVFTEGIPVGVVRRKGDEIFIEPEVDFSTLNMVSIQRRHVEGILSDGDLN